GAPGGVGRPSPPPPSGDVAPRCGRRTPPPPPPRQYTRSKLGLLSGRERARFPPPLDQAMHPRAAHTERRRNIIGVTARIPRPRDPLPQIHRIRRHRHLPSDGEVPRPPYYVQVKTALGSLAGLIS